jgi:hypothetical protein
VTTYSSRAHVITESPARYAKQLASHLGHKLPFTHDDDRSWTVQLETAQGLLVAGDGVLSLHVESSDEETLARLQDVLARHLERFGQRHELTVAWHRNAA